MSVEKAKHTARMRCLMVVTCVFGCSTTQPATDASPFDRADVTDVAVPDAPNDLGLDAARDAGDAGDAGVVARDVPSDLGPFRNDRPSRCAGATCRSLVAGDAHTCLALRGVRCAGRNTQGQLGDGTTVSRSTLTVVPGTLAMSLSAGSAHTCGIEPEGDVRCWGSNEYGQLGRAPGGFAMTPMLPIPGVSRALQVASGQSHACALSEDGLVRCWGDNRRGQLGVESVMGGALAVVALTDVVGVAIRGARRDALLGGGARAGESFSGAAGGGDRGDGAAARRVRGEPHAVIPTAAAPRARSAVSKPSSRARTRGADVSKPSSRPRGGESDPSKPSPGALARGFATSKSPFRARTRGFDVSKP